MLSYILRIMQEFERAHGKRPNLIYLNPRHMDHLRYECPDLFSENRPVPLGFRMILLPEDELPHPKAAWLPPRVSAARGQRRQKQAADRRPATKRKSRAKH